MSEKQQAVTRAYQRVEKAVVGAYQAIESTVVDGYTKIEDAFVKRYLLHKGETVTEAKARLRAQQED